MDVSKLFDRGSQAFERGNWELAIMIWQQLLTLQPDHTDARKLLREAENRKWTQNGCGGFAKATAFIKGFGSILASAFHSATKNYDRAIIDCEKVLTHDPNCTPVLWALSRAATKGEHLGVAIMTIEYIRDHNPKNKSALRQVARLYEEADEIARAIDAWQKLKGLVPNDREAQTKLRDLAAMKTMVDGRYDTATQEGATYRDSLKSKDDSEGLEQKGRIVRTAQDLDREIERVKKDVDAEPNNKRHVLQLGDLYRRGKRYEEARKSYNRGREIDPMDATILERLGDMRVEEYDGQEEALKKQLEAAPGDAALTAELQTLRKEKFEFRREEYARQVHARPTDAGLRSKLGDLFFGEKMFDEAAVEYQKAATDPRMRRRCLKLLGICLYNTGKFQLAASQFEQAVSDGTAASREVRDIMYNQARTYEKLGNLDRAAEVLREIFNVDMAYKDVQERLERIMQTKDEQQPPPDTDTSAPEGGTT
jgi:tetratricopeptide (TPR) repeat protein